MLATSICREVHFTVLPSTTMSGSSRVPRCLFGAPNSRETAEMLQEALDAERKSFARRWGVDPCADDKENDCRWKLHDQSSKKRSSPYSKQTNIHDYWRARKTCDNGKKPLASSTDSAKQQNADSKSSMKPLKNSN
ncbi:hypothetical protein KPH14_003002 [Odynerus spinipes]|uniref:Uncharacterized protein n=1 Tax=Odynerus spinipes TaxID=1348599 RepID=A0AAD9RWM4_9HYME|nr:hypothetical protein KPH14_003002 [Odynerus spinipes]